MKAGHIWQRWDIYCMLEECSEHENFLLITNKKQNGTFLHSETFLPTDWQYIWKRKANAYHTPWSKSTDAIFWQLQDPGMHYIADFGSVILTYLPQDQYKKSVLFFCIRSIITDSNFVLYTSSQLCTYLHPILYFQVHLTRLHLNTSWKTRHLVFSHITSKKEISSSSRALKTFTSGTIYKNVIWKVNSRPILTHPVV